MSSLIRLGTRSSALALTQSGHVAQDLVKLGHQVELVPMLSPGDLSRVPLTGLAQEGIFVSSVREALLRNEIDIAVHSCKDVPTVPAPGITLGAVPKRVDPRDTFISRYASIAELPSGARVGTCSVRRAAWVSRVRPDVLVVPIRGNIDTRISAMHDGEFDAIILAAAGVLRLGRESEIRDYIDEYDLVPAPAQGALSIECRTEDQQTREILHLLDHHPSHQAILLERQIFQRIDATDSSAFGVLCNVSGQEIKVLADISQSDGSDRFICTHRQTYGTSDEFSVAKEHLENLVVEQLLNHQHALVQVS